MFRHLPKPNRILAAFLLLTLSGACCVFCCEEIFASSAAASEHCPMVKSEHCNFTKAVVPESASTVAANAAPDCCGLKINFFIGKLEASVYSGQAITGSVVTVPEFLPASLQARERYKPDFYRAPLFERPDIHIANCVFRI